MNPGDGTAATTGPDIADYVEWDGRQGACVIKELYRIHDGGTGRMYLAPGFPAIRIGRCHQCGADALVRINRETGEAFLGCSRYPRCDATRPIPKDIEMRLRGATRLPGF